MNLFKLSRRFILTLPLMVSVAFAGDQANDDDNNDPPNDDCNSSSYASANPGECAGCGNEEYDKKHPEECKEKKKSCRGCDTTVEVGENESCPAGTEEMGVSSIQFSVKLGSGGVKNEPTIRYGELLLHEDYPSQKLFSPQGLLFTQVLATPLLVLDEHALPAGVDKRLRYIDEAGRKYDFEFKSGATTATLYGDMSGTSNMRLKRINSAGKVVASGESGYVRYVKGMPSKVFYDAANLRPVSYIDDNGRKLNLSNLGIDVVYDQGSSVLRQIFTDYYLFDLVIPQDGVTAQGTFWKYEIRCYYAVDVEGKDETGLYQTAKESHPYITHRIENFSDNKDKDFSNVKISKFDQNQTLVSEAVFQFNQSSNQWSFSKGNGLYNETLIKEENQAKSMAKETNRVTDSAGNTLFEAIVKSYRIGSGKRRFSIARGKETTSIFYYGTKKNYNGYIALRDAYKTASTPKPEIIGYDSEGDPIYQQVPHSNNDQLVKEYNNYFIGQNGEELPNPVFITADALKVGKERATVYPDGRWVINFYDNEQRIAAIAKPVGDLSFSAVKKAQTASALPQNCRVITYDYTPLAGDENSLEYSAIPRTVTTSVNGVVVKKSYKVITTEGGGKKEITEDAVSAGAVYGDGANVRTVKVYYPSGADQLVAGRLKYEVREDGSRTDYSFEKGHYTVNLTPQLCAFTPDAAGEGFRITKVNSTTTSPQGIPFKTTKETVVYDSSVNNVMREEYVYTGSGYERVKWTVREFDLLKHTTKRYKSNGDVTEISWGCCNKDYEIMPDGTEYLYTYNILGQLIEKRKKGRTTLNGAEEPSKDIVETYVYDALDRKLSTTVSAGGLSLTSSTVYDVNGKQLSQTSTEGHITSFAENGLTKTTTYQSTGTRVETNYLDGRLKSVTGTAVVPEFYTYGVNVDGTAWEKVNYGVAGSKRWIKTTKNLLGNLIEVETPTSTDGLTKIVRNSYDSRGNQTKVSTVDSNGKKLIGDKLYGYNDLNELVRTSLDLNDNGQVDLNFDRVDDTETVYVKENNVWWRKSTAKTYPNDNDATAVVVVTTKTQLTGLSDSLKAKAVTTDIHGNKTITTTVYDRANKTLTTTTNTPTSNVDSLQVLVNGNVTSVRNSQNVTYSYEYDALGRRTAMIDPRIGRTNIVVYNDKGQVESMTDAAGNTQRYIYSGCCNKVVQTTSALGKKEYKKYNLLGLLTNVWGETTYPVEYGYDSFGQKVTMTTFGSVGDFTTVTWPSQVKGNTTTWNYDEASGVLLSKVDAKSKATTYTYDVLGRIKTRTWARTTAPNAQSPMPEALTTTYSYDFKTGQQTLVNYSDSTPDISFTYNRLGQQRNIVDAAGTRTFYYNDKLQQSSEAISGLYSETISRNYQADGRYSGFTTGKGHVNAGQYDLKGRFAKLFPAGSQSTPFVYNYASTGELTSITHAGGLERKFMLESNRNFIASVENKFNSTVVSKFDYVNDEIGRRSSVTKTGNAFTQNDTINYTYNDRSEVVGAVAVNDSSYNYDYSFDNLGNRTSFASDETGTQTVTNYQTNELNQYTSISVPQSLITPVFDADGNQTQLSNSKGSWNLVYNAENRIIEMTSDTQKLEFVYDYMGRRVSKKVYQKDGTNNYQLKTNNSFIYDAYLLIEILDGANEGLKQTFTWNGNEAICTDVYENNSSERYFYTHDANKNVSELIGKVVKSTFSTPDSGLINPFRFSNEYHDDETGLVYYNYRYYNPELGRWTKRDPIEEQGGMNLYGFIGNGVISGWDLLGLDTYGVGGATNPPYPSGYAHSSSYSKYASDGGSNWGKGFGLFGKVFEGTSQGNCYRYALNDPMKDGEEHSKQPGGGWLNDTTITCAEVKSKARRDGLEPMPAGGCKNVGGKLNFT